MRPNSPNDHETGSGLGGRTDRVLGNTARLRPTTVAAALLALVLIAAACSSTPNSPGVAGGGPPTTAKAASPGKPQSSDALAEMTAYAKCMRSHGIADFPDPTPNPGGPGGSFDFAATGDLNPSNPTYQDANGACQSPLPNRGKIPAPSARQLAEEVKLAACMRAHGVPNFPDPNGQGAFNLGQVDRGTPQFSSAIKTCRSVAKFQGPMPVEAGAARGRAAWVVAQGDRHRVGIRHDRVPQLRSPLRRHPPPLALPSLRDEGHMLRGRALRRGR